MVLVTSLMMSRVVRWWSHSKSVALIWFISVFLFFSLFKMSLRSSSSSDPAIVYSEIRSKLYDKMASDLDEHGASFLKHGETSQSLSLSDIFTLRDGSVTPVLKAADPPVRANVLYLSTNYSVPISKAVEDIFSPHFDKVIWLQNSSVYHFSMFHASHHISPVRASKEEIETEASAVQAVVKTLCPLKIVLDRVVLTSTGVLLGCWQVASGTDPITLRAKLKAALPNAPEKQLYDNAILHTSLARLLNHPTTLSTDLHNTADELKFFHELVAQLNNQIGGFEAVVSELWYVEEYDVLALALNGRMKVRNFQFGCLRT